MTFSSASISAPQAIKKSLKSLFPSFPVMDAKASLRGLKSLACLHSSHRRYSCGLSKLFCREKVELERGGGGDLSDTICFGSAR